MFIAPAIKTATKIIRTANRYNQKLRYADPTNKFIRKYVPRQHRRTAHQLYDSAIAGTVISEIANIIYDAIPQKQLPKTGYFRKARNNMEFSKRRRKYTKRCYPNKRRY